MRRINLSMEGLIAVVTVAREGSLERAGKVLGLGKSAVGKHVGIVEAKVGAPLFDRHGGRWALNEEGRLFAPNASQSILYARMGLDLVQSHVKLQTNRLFVGYSTFLHPQLIDVIKHVRLERRNDVRIEYESWLTEAIVSAVIQGELHVGFGFLPVKEPELLVYEIFEEPVVVCMPNGHPLSVRHAIRPEALEGLPMIAVGRLAVSLMCGEMEDYFRSLGLGLNFVEECFSPNEALHSVAHGNHLCLLPASQARSSDGVVVRPLSDRLFACKYGVFVRQDHDDATVEDFLNIVRQRTDVLRNRRR
jgi:DNA-binding transcriptional LysR family regulator